MKALLTGAHGMMAHALIPALEQAGHEVMGLGRGDADVSQPGSLDPALRLFRPDWVFHLAAWTRVDDCEADPDRAHAVNALGARNAALAARGCGAALMIISTDYVFDGLSSRPYRETDAVAPQSVYAASKWAGEQMVREATPRHVIVRTSWLFGSGGHNFVDTVARRAHAQEPLTVVEDQRGSPTWTRDLVVALQKLAEASQYGTYHVSGTGDCSWWELASYVARKAGATAAVERTTTAALGRPARRPAYSVLDNHLAEQVTGHRMLHWKQAVDRYLETHSSVSSVR